MCVWPDALRSRHSVWPHSQISFSWLCSHRSGYCCVVTSSFLIRKGQIHCLSSCITLIFRMAMNLCSVPHLPSPDVSFGHSLKGRGGLCVIFTSNTQISFFVEMDFYNSGIRKTCWLFKSLFFSFSRISPICFTAGLAVSVYVFLCMNEHVLVGSCQDICSLLHLSVVCGIRGELEWLYEMLYESLFMHEGPGPKILCNLSPPLAFLFCFPFFLSFLLAHFSFLLIFLSLCPSVPNND